MDSAGHLLLQPGLLQKLASQDPTPWWPYLVTWLTPAVLFAMLVAVSAAAYVPMALTFNPMHWSTTFGPFALQTSRIPHYLVYFLIGLGIGAYGIERTLLARDGRFGQRWPLGCCQR